MLIDMIPVHVMKMTIVKIVHMAFMLDRSVSAVWAMLMGMIGMVLLGAGHDLSFLRRGLSGPSVIAFRGMFDRALHQLQNVLVQRRIVDVLCLSSPFDKPRLV